MADQISGGIRGDLTRRVRLSNRDEWTPNAGTIEIHRPTTTSPVVTVALFGYGIGNPGTGQRSG
jgi:hypothetical protein